MTNRVIPIRRGVKVSGGGDQPPTPPNQEVKDALKWLNELVDSGQITEIACVGVGDTLFTVRIIAGTSKQPFLLSGHIDTMGMLYKEENIYPALVSEEDYELLDD